MSDQFLAEIRAFPFNFAPQGWALCNGQIMSISQNAALFSLLGTNFGGDGRSTFGLPNLQGRVPVDQGQGQSLSQYVVGETGGTSSVQLSAAQNVAHAHALVASTVVATSASPTGAVYATGHYTTTTGGGPVEAYAATTPGATMSATALSPAGGGAAHNNMMPYLTLNFCIALTGIFPPRS
jgi:microcystin-dependent protein